MSATPPMEQGTVRLYLQDEVLCAEAGLEKKQSMISQDILITHYRVLSGSKSPERQSLINSWAHQRQGGGGGSAP